MIRVYVSFVPRDLWIGLFIGPKRDILSFDGRTDFIVGHRQSWYICILPMLPIIIEHTVEYPIQHKRPI